MAELSSSTRAFSSPVRRNIVSVHIHRIRFIVAWLMEGYIHRDERYSLLVFGRALYRFEFSELAADHCSSVCISECLGNLPKLIRCPSECYGICRR